MSSGKDRNSALEVIKSEMEEEDEEEINHIYKTMSSGVHLQSNVGATTDSRNSRHQPTSPKQAEEETFQMWEKLEAAKRERIRINNMKTIFKNQDLNVSNEDIECSFSPDAEKIK